MQNPFSFLHTRHLDIHWVSDVFDMGSCMSLEYNHQPKLSYRNFLLTMRQRLLSDDHKWWHTATWSHVPAGGCKRSRCTLLGDDHPSKPARHKETKWSIGIEFLLCESTHYGINVPCGLHRSRGEEFRREARSTSNHRSRWSVWFIIHQQARSQEWEWRRYGWKQGKGGRCKICWWSGRKGIFYQTTDLQSGKVCGLLH